MAVTQIRPTPTSRRGVYVAAAVATAVVLIAATMIIGRLAGEPHFVDRVTIADPTPYAVDVDIAGRSGDGWVGLGTVAAGRSQTFQEVLDQGRTWRFRFSYAGVVGGEVRVSRDELERDRWRVSVPATVATRLAEAGLSPAAT